MRSCPFFPFDPEQEPEMAKTAHQDNPDRTIDIKKDQSP
jgi:hypothetical protein